MRQVLLFKIVTLLSLHLMSVASNNNTTSFTTGSLFNTSVCKFEVKCPYVKFDRVIPQNESCCKNLTKAFECSWFHKMQLLRYLNLLKSWNCSDQLEKECRLKTFDFNEFSEMAYLSICDSDSFSRTCKVKNNTFSQNLGFVSSKEHILKDSCIAVNEFYSFGAESFVEIFSTDIPMCPVVWCGFQSKNITNFGLSIWDCATTRFIMNLYCFTFTFNNSYRLIKHKICFLLKFNKIIKLFIVNLNLLKRQTR